MMRRVLCLGGILVIAVAGCGGGASNENTSFPHNQSFKDLLARLQLDVGQRANQQAAQQANARSSGGSNRDEAYFIRTHHERWTVAEAATYALVRIGAPAVAQLREELKFDDRERRLKAIDILARIGPDAKTAVPDLIQMLQSEDERVKKYAARALGQIGPDAGAAVSELIKALNQ